MWRVQRQQIQEIEQEMKQEIKTKDMGVVTNPWAIVYEREAEMDDTCPLTALATQSLLACPSSPHPHPRPHSHLQSPARMSLASMRTLTYACRPSANKTCPTRTECR